MKTLIVAMLALVALLVITSRWMGRAWWLTWARWPFARTRAWPAHRRAHRGHNMAGYVCQVRRLLSLRSENLVLFGVLGKTEKRDSVRSVREGAA